MAGQIVDAVPIQMGVTVDEARHEGPARLLDGRGSRIHFRTGAHREDPAVLELDESFLDRSRRDRPPVDGFLGHGQHPAREHDVFGRKVEHGLGDLLIAPRCRFGHAPDFSSCWGAHGRGRLGRRGHVFEGCRRFPLMVVASDRHPPES